MKILQVLPTLSAGGAEGFVTNLGVSLAALGCEVRFFLLAGVRAERGRVLHERLMQAGIEVIGAEERNIRSPWNVVRLARLIRCWRPDTVQANLHSAEVVTAAAKALAIGSGTTYTRRLANTALAGRRSRRVARRLERAFLLTIACSPAVAEVYPEFTNGRAVGRMATIANGGHLLGEVPSAEDRAEARRHLGIAEGAFVVGHIGRMFAGNSPGVGLASSQKAHDVVLQAFALAFGDDSACALVLVGDGPLRGEAEALAARLGIAGQTHFLGRQPEPWPALLAADLFCFPSRYEGLPNVLPEAASCGLPVVASNIPEIRHLYPGGAWRLAPVDDVAGFAEAMRSVRENRAEFVEKACAAAPGFRERFLMKSCAQRYLEAYRSMLGGAPFSAHGRRQSVVSFNTPGEPTP